MVSRIVKSKSIFLVNEYDGLLILLILSYKDTLAVSTYLNIRKK